MREGVTLYDAAYVALAQHLGVKLYTADERLLRKMGESPLIEHIMMRFKPPRKGDDITIPHQLT
ncbi:MAG: twitching motility protein PilT [Candidatus Bathyarchaeota archaeon B23]|nr:MAG: twitching motility protein PilT [Candidatus Bathyarchaeota archaeon B23]